MEGKIKTVSVGNESITYAALENLVYVKKPVNSEYQKLSIYFPSAYLDGESVCGYDFHSAPIFMPNAVGGYMSASIKEPGEHRKMKGVPNSLFKALQRGYVVVSCAIRGRNLKEGKAPSCIVDYKAAVRYLRFNGKLLPGNKEKIITSGTSAGGALSALMGAAGNAFDYYGELGRIGAYSTRDDVFACNCYCPITNLENADKAYEWQFKDVHEYHRKKMKMDEGNRPVFTSVDGKMSEEQIKMSNELASLFPKYLNSLRLKDEQGNVLTLDENGQGTFLERLKQEIIHSYEKSQDKSQDIPWIIFENGKAVDIDFYEYVKSITRMKETPAFDSVDNNSPENSLFGNEINDQQHFTKYSYKYSKCNGNKADENIVKMMNPMRYLNSENESITKHWRIRHGEIDRDTSLAISLMLTLKLRELGINVDYHLPWNIPHSGDYDLEELFDWIDSICK